MSGPFTTTQHTDPVLTFKDSLVSDRSMAMFNTHNTPASIDTNTSPKSFRVSLKNHSSDSTNEMAKSGQDQYSGAVEAPDSPCTLLGEEIDLDEICSPLSIGSSVKSFIPETPPHSPSTLFGGRFDLDKTSSRTSSSIANESFEADDQPGSPTTVLEDESSQNKPDSPSLTPDSAFLRVISSGMATYTSQQYAPMCASSSAPRTYVQRPHIMCEAIPLIDKWPDFIVKAFIDEDWKFGLDHQGKTVLELVSGREDLAGWFAKQVAIISELQGDS